MVSGASMEARDTYVNRFGQGMSSTLHAATFLGLDRPGTLPASAPTIPYNLRHRQGRPCISHRGLTVRRHNRLVSLSDYL